MSNKQFVRRAPKRAIKKIVANLRHLMSNSITETVLHTCTDAETLVRTIIKLNVTYDGTSVVWISHDLLLEHQPQGQSISGPTSSELLEQNEPKQALWRDGGAANFETLSGDAPRFRYDADLKSMRKLQPGDQIALDDIASLASTYRISGWIVLFFKEG